MVVAKLFDLDDGQKDCGREKSHRRDRSCGGPSLRGAMVFRAIDNAVASCTNSSLVRMERSDVMNESTAVTGF